MSESLEARWLALEERIGYRFANRELLAEAMTHRSFANESRHQELPDNERLEFLGDAVLDLVVGHALFAAFGRAAEGELSRLRADLVSAPSLARLAGELELGECLRLGRGEARSGGRHKESLLADSLEALVGGIFVDAGYAAAAAVAGRLFAPFLQATRAPAGHDYKTRLQELLQSRQRQLPEYVLVAAHGPDHQRRYEVEVLIDGGVAGSGAGPTKKRAEQAAARHALERLDAQEHDNE